MPYTRKQVKLLLSDASPLTGPQQDKVKAELHADPSLGHAKKGSPELKRARLSPATASKIRARANAVLGKK